MSAEQLIAFGPVRAAFHSVIEVFDRTKQLTRLDEETLTAFLFGGVAIKCHDFVDRYGSGVIDEDRTAQLGPYKKSAQHKNWQGESASGADFALVFGEDADWVKLAIFQAKKGKTKQKAGGAWEIDVRRRPKDTARHAQLVVLVATGRRLASKEPSTVKDTVGAIAGLLGLSKLERKEVLSKLGWIYYLGYRDKQPVCVPLSAVPASILEKEIGKTSEKNALSLEQHATFYSVLQTGIGTTTRLQWSCDGNIREPDSSNDEGVQPWLRVPRSSLPQLLPALLDLMPIYVGDDKGEGSWDLDASSSPESIPAKESDASQLKALTDDVSRDAAMNAKARTPGM
jgi:hypothetical protein